jgi:hypothetical protein
MTNSQQPRTRKETMSLLILAKGISRLSELEIDTDKDWGQFGIFNLKEVALNMGTGDLAVHDGQCMVRFPPGAINMVLTSQGPGKMPTWAPGGIYLKRYLPVTVEAGHGEGYAAPHLEEIRSAIITSQYSQTPHSFISQPVTVFISDSYVPDTSQLKLALATDQVEYIRKSPLSAAVADDGGVQTNETAAANNDTANDMTLLPAVPEVGDVYYFAYSSTFPAVHLKQDTPGVGVWSTLWEYWDGSSWAMLPGVSDPSNGFRPASAGTYRISWDIPGDWAQGMVAGLGPYYWARCRVDAFTSITAQPKGTRAWIESARGMF